MTPEQCVITVNKSKELYLDGITLNDSAFVWVNSNVVLTSYPAIVAPPVVKMRRDVFLKTDVLWPAPTVGELCEWLFENKYEIDLAKNDVGQYVSNSYKYSDEMESGGYNKSFPDDVADLVLAAWRHGK